MFSNVTGYNAHTYGGTVDQQSTPPSQREFSPPPAKVSRSSVHVTAVPSGTYETIEDVCVTGVQVENSSQLPPETHVSLIGPGVTVGTIRNAKVVGVQLGALCKFPREGGFKEKPPSPVEPASDRRIPEKVSQKMDLEYGASDEEILKVLAERTRLYAHPVAQLTVSDMPVLGYVAGHGKVQTLQAVLQAGADLNEAASYTRRTPLMFAALKKNHACLAELLRHKARTDLVDRQGKNALNIAIEEGDSEAIKMLRAAESQKVGRYERPPSPEGSFLKPWIPGEDPQMDDESSDEERLQAEARTVPGEIGVRLTGDDLRRITRQASAGHYVTHERIYNDAGGPGRTEMHNVRVVDVDWGVYPSGKKRQ